MKKHCLFLIVLNFINCSTHIHGMKREDTPIDPVDLSILLTYPNTILDHIASFLSFHDYETEKEFIERTRSLTMKTVPQEYIRNHFPQSNIKYAAYSSDNTKIIISEQQSTLEMIENKVIMPKLIIITNRHTQQHKQCCIGTTHQYLALSRNALWFATIYADHILDTTTQRTINKYSLVVTNFNWNGNNNHDIPLSFELSDQHPTIAFNKQDTHIIVHAKNAQHKIFLVSNTIQQQKIHQKTLTKYFQQQGICKNLLKQLEEQQKNSGKATTHQQLLMINGSKK